MPIDERQQEKKEDERIKDLDSKPLSDEKAEQVKGGDISIVKRPDKGTP